MLEKMLWFQLSSISYTTQQHHVETASGSLMSRYDKVEIEIPLEIQIRLIAAFDSSTVFSCI